MKVKDKSRNGIIANLEDAPIKRYLTAASSFVAGNPVLHPPVVMEELGGGQDCGSDDGP